MRWILPGVTLEGVGEQRVDVWGGADEQGVPEGFLYLFSTNCFSQHLFTLAEGVVSSSYKHTGTRMRTCTHARTHTCARVGTNTPPTHVHACNILTHTQARTHPHKHTHVPRWPLHP